MTTDRLLHVPVLPGEVLRVLSPERGERVLDATLGLGGHASAFLEATVNGELVGLDADAVNLAEAAVHLHPFGKRIRLIHANFRDLTALALAPFDILFADLGLSSPHVDDPLRGFTFRAESPLDLRFDRSRGQTAAEFLEHASEDEIADVLWKFGELRQARTIAGALARERTLLRTTADVWRCVERAVGWRAPSIIPQVFQALRIVVNDELGALEELLRTGPRLLRPGGRMGVISYHSLEDRLVKRAFRALAAPPARFILRTRRPVVATAQEIRANPRARSARLRAICYTPHNLC